MGMNLELHIKHFCTSKCTETYNVKNSSIICLFFFPKYIAELIIGSTTVNKADVNFLYTPRIPANFKDYVNSQIISTIPYNNHESRIKLKRWFIFSNPRGDDVKYGVQVNCKRQTLDTEGAPIQFLVSTYTRFSWHFFKKSFMTKFHIL